MKLVVLLLGAGFALFSQQDPDSVTTTTTQKLSVDKTGMVDAKAWPLKQLIELAYKMPSTLVFGPAWIEDQQVDLTHVPKASLAQTLADQFHITTHKETRNLDVYVLKVIPGKEDLLAHPGPPPKVSNGEQHLTGKMTVKSLAEEFAPTLHRPVLDETGLTTRFAVDLAWDPDDSGALTAMIRQRLGLEAVPAVRPVEVLVVEGAPPASRQE